MDGSKKDKSILPLALLVFQIIFVIILISIAFLTIKNSRIGDFEYERQPAITIEGINSQLPDTSSTYIGLIERDLARAVKSNLANFDIKDSKAQIREGTFIAQEFENLNGTYSSMIVDIPNLQQSYQIYAQFPTADTTPGIASYDIQYVLCLDDSAEIIYPDFQCEDGYTTNIRASIVLRYLQYFNFEYFSPSFKNDDFSTIYIYPINYNIDDATKQSYIQQTKEAIESLGISPDLFDYHVMALDELDYFNPTED